MCSQEIRFRRITRALLIWHIWSSSWLFHYCFAHWELDCIVKWISNILVTFYTLKILGTAQHVKIVTRRTVSTKNEDAIAFASVMSFEDVHVLKSLLIIANVCACALSARHPPMITAIRSSGTELDLLHNDERTVTLKCSQIQCMSVSDALTCLACKLPIIHRLWLNYPPL